MQRVYRGTKSREATRLRMEWERQVASAKTIQRGFKKRLSRRAENAQYVVVCSLELDTATEWLGGLAFGDANASSCVDG